MSDHDFDYSDYFAAYNHSDDNDDDRYEFGRSDDNDDDRYEFGRSDDNDDDRYEFGRSDDNDDDRYEFGRSGNNDDAYAHDNSDDDHGYAYAAGIPASSSAIGAPQGGVIQLQVEREEKTFSFDANGNVTGVGEIRGNGTIKSERIDQDESFARYGNFVIKTESEGYGKVEFTAYADGDGDGRWAEVAEGYGQLSIAAFVDMIPANYANFG